MNSGKLALVDSSRSELESLYGELSGSDTPFDKFAESIEVRDEISLSNSRTAYSGVAALEDVQEVEQREILEGGEINSEKTLEKTVKVTSFLLVPDSFLVTSSSSGSFLIPMLNRNTKHSAFEVQIDLGEYLDRIEDAQSWKIGFEQRTDEAENGVLHGRQLFEDTEFGDTLGKARKSQIGIEHPLNEDIAKILITKSGYIEFYQPDEFSTQDFIEYIEENVLDCLTIR